MPTHLALTNDVCQPLAEREHYVAFDLAVPEDGTTPTYDAGGPERAWRRGPLVLDPLTARVAGAGAGSPAGDEGVPPVWAGLGIEGDQRSGGHRHE